MFDKHVPSGQQDEHGLHNDLHDAHYEHKEHVELGGGEGRSDWRMGMIEDQDQQEGRMYGGGEGGNMYINMQVIHRQPLKK